MGGEGERADRQTTWAQGCVGRGVQSLTKTGLKTTPPPTEHSCQTKINRNLSLQPWLPFHRKQRRQKNQLNDTTGVQSVKHRPQKTLEDTPALETHVPL